MLLSKLSGRNALPIAAKNWIEGGKNMNAKKLALFGGAAVVVAGGLIYSLGIYPPASSRDGQGAIGERQVYRVEQPADASVNPGAAPVAMTANAGQLKNSRISQLKDGQLVQMNGQMYQLNGGQLVALMNGQNYQFNGQMLQFNNGAFYQINGQMFQINGQMFQLTSGQLVQMNGQMYQLNGGQLVALMNGQMFQMNGQMLRFMNGQVYQMNGQLAK